MTNLYRILLFILLFLSEIFEKIIEMRDDFGLTILLVEQNAKRALEISDNGYMFVSGRVAFEGTAEELLNHEKFKEYSLGITAI